MGYIYGEVSESRLATCHPNLIRICRELIKWEDVHVVCGFRDKDTQELMFDMGRSMCHWPESNHNVEAPDPETGELVGRSEAVDLVLWSASKRECLWDDMLQIGRMAGRFLQIAEHLKIYVRYGPDFMPAHIFDAYHFELI
jgi:hypothetical protein